MQLLEILRCPFCRSALREDGDVLTCTAVVTGKREDRGEHLVDLDLTVANQDGVTAITGSATAAVA